MADALGFTPDPPIRTRDLRIGCIGAGMIMAECHLAAYKEAIDFINRDPARAAQIYQEIERNKTYSVDELVTMLTDKSSMEFTIVPHNITKYTDFMHRMGSIACKPASWKDLFFPEIHSLPGS